MSVTPSKSKTARQKRLEAHVRELHKCERCPRMHRPAVSGGPVLSKVMIVGQAPGVKEPVVGRPFAWTAGRTMFGWFERWCGIDEATFRATIYMAAVCRCFPGKNGAGGDRVPAPDEIVRCSEWLDRELEILEPELVIPVGKLAIRQFLPEAKLVDQIGKEFRVTRGKRTFTLVPLPHPSGASPWHRIEPGKTLVEQAMKMISNHLNQLT